MAKRIGWLWKILTLLVIATITALTFMDERYAVDFARSIINGETSIGFWMKHGLTFSHSLVIAICCSTYDIFTWFYLFNSIHDGFHKMDSWLVTFFKNHVETAAAKGGWVRKFWWLAEKTYRFCVPQPASILRGGEWEAEKNRLSYYCPLPLYGLCPGYIWTGIGYSISFQLEQISAFCILALFNGLKMVGAGYLTLKIGMWGVFFLVLAMPFTKFGIEKFLKSIRKK